MYSAKTLRRIMREIMILEKSKDSLAKDGIYVYYDEGNIGKFTVLIVGTEDTPYEDGMYPFSIELPKLFPMEPPKVQIILPNDGRSRMNPNLYVDGKVCLSMINTWDGPRWLPTFTLEKVIVTIQAMVMNNTPLINEPGHETDSPDKLTAYNEAVLHQNYALAVIQMYELRNNENYKCFSDLIMNLVLENKDFYIKQLKSYVEKYSNRNEFDAYIYGFRPKNRYKQMLKYIETIGSSF